MSVHEFEKQVQAKMEQLKLRPSEAVWTKVNMRVRKERRRRRLILWMPILLLMLGAGGYFMFNNTSNNNQQITASEKNSTLSNTESSSSVTTATPESASTEQEQPASSLPVENNDQAAKAPDRLPAPTNGSGHVLPPANAGQSTTQPAPDANNNPANGASTTPVKEVRKHPLVQPGSLRPGANELAAPVVKSNNGQRNNQSAPIVGESKLNNKTGNRKKNNNSHRVADPPLAKFDPIPIVQEPARSSVDTEKNKETVTSVIPSATDSYAAEIARVVPQQTAQPTLPAPDSAATTKKKKVTAIAILPEPPKRKPSGWSFGIAAEGGGSHISKGGPFDLLNKKNEEPENLAPLNSPSNTNIGGPAAFAQAPAKPSGIKTGFSWSAGGFAQKKISERVSISAGIQYAYFSQQTNVGQYIRSSLSVSNQNYDQIVPGYYQGRTNLNSASIGFTSAPRPPLEQEYTNKYHFIEMPLKVHWRITDEEQAPIIVDGGLSLARMLSTNALHYDGANDVYYKDYSYFNKMQAGITAGINIALFNESNHPVWIGPTIKYQLSNLLKTDLSKGQHLWSFGLGARMFLKK